MNMCQVLFQTLHIIINLISTTTIDVNTLEISKALLLALL